MLHRLAGGGREDDGPGKEKARVEEVVDRITDSKHGGKGQVGRSQQ